MSKYQLPVDYAMELTGATCAKSTLYQRWKRFKDRQQERIFGAMGRDGTDGINDAEDDDGGGKAGGDPPIDAVVCTPKPTKPTPGGLTTAEVESGLNDCPAWIDPVICEKMLTRGKRKSLTEAHSTRLTGGQASTTYRAGRYKNAFKACTSLFSPPVEEADERRRTRHHHLNHLPPAEPASLLVAHPPSSSSSSPQHE